MNIDAHGLNGPNSIEVPSLSDGPEATIISRKPSPIRRRPPQRAHILNNPNALIEGEFNSNTNQPSTSSDLEEPFIRNNHLSSTSRGTTLNPFSTYTNSVGLSSISSAADVESTRISSLPSSSSLEPNNHYHNNPSIHSLADELESNYNFNNNNNNNNGNTDLFNYNNAVGGNTSPINNNQSPSLHSEINHDLNTTPYLTTTERSNSLVTESIISSTIQTTTQSPSTHLSSSSLATTASSIRSGNSNNNFGGVRRGRPRTSANTQTPQSIVQPKHQTQPKRIVQIPAVTKSSIIASNPAVVAVTSAPSIKPQSSSVASDAEPITWDQANNKVTCNRRGVYVHPQSKLFFNILYLFLFNL